jgi:hypothetical protein
MLVKNRLSQVRYALASGETRRCVSDGAGHFKLVVELFDHRSCAVHFGSLIGRRCLNIDDDGPLRSRSDNRRVRIEGWATRRCGPGCDRISVTRRMRFTAAPGCGYANGRRALDVADRETETLRRFDEMLVVRRIRAVPLRFVLCRSDEAILS